MYIYLKLLFILLITSLQVVNSELLKNPHCAVSKKLDEQCGGYCYGIVKPLLQYAASIRSKENQFSELIDKIQNLKATIKMLKSQIELSNKHTNNCLTNNELKDSNEVLVDKIQYMIFAKNNNEAQLNTELRNRDSEILELKARDIANSAKIKELEKSLLEQNTKIIENLDSSCIGKLTNIYDIKVPGTSFFAVPCDSSLAGSGWMVVQRRQDGTENFNRTWEDYRLGFGNLHAEFFIGLEKLYLLTQSQPHELYIYLKDFNNQVRYARYSKFLIGREEENFKLKSLGKYSGNADDGMAGHINMEFSTPDKDHDTGSQHCAQEYKSGWWFHKCYTSNLNGEYRTTRLDQLYGIDWFKWHKESLKFVQMMIRPTNKKA
ncbi:fibrinogen-like protein 1 [Drosophila montana]|uniref:fibrinogen-like protein 1 n=1 Tax=Drosophila montana TaxID=40370 RepID=UPI00313B60AD